MINFAICYAYDETLDFVKNEVMKCFRQREVQISVMCYHNAYELERCISCNCPDILFYDMEKDDGLMRKTVMNAKRENKRLISIITRARDYRPPAEDVLLEPLYVMPDKSRKHLWTYAALAYETILDDADSFSYYVRPDYIHTPVNEIRYFASEGRRTHIVAMDRRDIFYQKLDVVEKLLHQKNCQFLRIHKSYLVNAKYISGYSRDYVMLTTGEQLRISKYEYYKMLSDRLQNLKNTKLKYHPQYSQY
ncbi:MAG: LytTR family transcriptional regulator DNA-binding domain-containing protein [Lachnospiraceae bacterium]|nr:LytTR family transcriptional regulator DNA-binding domain-containing protein [Lachnospiraceae bacterium]